MTPPRIAGPGDEAAVVRLWSDCGLVVPWNDLCQDFRFAIDQPNSDILVCEADGAAIVASVMVGHDGHRGWIYYLCSAFDVRGQGLGRSMTVAAEEWLRERGIAKLQLMVRDTNTEVVSFYERLGFEVITRVVLQKWLRTPPRDPS